MSATSVITYTAKRELIAGHVVDTDYSIEFQRSAISKRKKVKRHDHPALDGNSQSRLIRSQYFWTFTTDDITEADIPLWEEFLGSVEGKERFTFDAYGSIASPGNPVFAKTEGMEWDEVRVGTQMKYVLTISLVVL